MDSAILNSIPRIVDGFRLEEIDGEILLYSPASTRSIYLNPSASVIWQLCDGENSVQHIVEALCEQFPESGDDIRNDVPQAIQSFLDNEAITLDSDAS